MKSSKTCSLINAFKNKLEDSASYDSETSRAELYG